MSFIRFPLAFVLLLSTCFVCNALKSDLATTHDIEASTKRAYNDSDGDWVRYLSARYYQDSGYREHRRPDAPPPRSNKKQRPPSPGTERTSSPSSSGSSCDVGVVTRLWNEREGPIDYGQKLHKNELVFPVSSQYSVGGKSLVIRVFVVSNLRDSKLRASEIQRLRAVDQYVTWGHEVIHDSETEHREVWFVVQKKMGGTRESWGKQLREKDIPVLKKEARKFYWEEYDIGLPKESEDEENRYVYWEGKTGWYAEIVGWFLPTIIPGLPDAEKLCIISAARLKHQSQ